MMTITKRMSTVFRLKPYTISFWYNHKRVEISIKARTDAEARRHWSTVWRLLGELNPASHPRLGDYKLERKDESR